MQSDEALLASARLAAQADLASDYFQLRGQDQLQVLLDDTVKADELALKITENRYRVGVAARADVVTAQTQLLSAQAQQVSVPIQRGTLEHAIAVLIGQQPATFSIAPVAIRTDVPTVPPDVPSKLLERRPDIAQAERQVAAANAQIGVAKAAYFPSFSLTGSVAVRERGRSESALQGLQPGLVHRPESRADPVRGWPASSPGGRCASGVGRIRR